MVSNKILLIDDDIEDYLIIKEALHDLIISDIIGYAENGEIALDLLDKQYEQEIELPHVIILDLNMPLMDGVTTLHYLKKDNRFAHIPVVIYSTSINPGDQKKCMQLGAYSCIAKPNSVEEIIQIGETLLAFFNNETVGSAK